MNVTILLMYGKLFEFITPLLLELDLVVVLRFFSSVDQWEAYRYKDRYICIGIREWHNQWSLLSLKCLVLSLIVYKLTSYIAS